MRSATFDLSLTPSTLIDHIATTSVDNIPKSGMKKVSLSDNYMVFCKRRLNTAVGVGQKLVITRKHEVF